MESEFGGIILDFGSLSDVIIQFVNSILVSVFGGLASLFQQLADAFGGITVV